MVSPGVPLTLPALVRVRARGVPIVGELELGLAGDGGRRHRHHRHQRQDDHDRAHRRALAGAGAPRARRRQHRHAACPSTRSTSRPTASSWPRSSSFQLESTALFRPRVAAVLNITPDHLDRHGSFERYVEAKARILANQTEADCAVLNADDPGAAALAARARGRVLWFSRLRRDDPRRLRRRRAGSSRGSTGTSSASAR